MKRIILALIFIFLLFLSTSLYSQLWKQYADSAEACAHGGEDEKCLQYLYKAKDELAKDSSKTATYAKASNSVGIQLMAMGDFQKAEHYILEARLLLEETVGKKHTLYARNSNSLGMLYAHTGAYEKAEPFYLEALQIRTLRQSLIAEGNLLYFRVCNNLANLYKDMGQFEKAEKLYLEVKKISEKVFGKDFPDYATSCNDLGNVYTKMGQYENAVPLYLEAMQIREKVLGKEHTYYERTCIDLATLYWNIQQPQKADEYYSEAFKSQNIQIKKIFRFSSELEKESYLKTIIDFNNCFLSFTTSAYSHFSQGFAYNISRLNRNLILSSSQQLRQSIFSSDDTSIKNKYNNWINSREQLAFWYTKPIGERPAYVKDLEEQANILEKELTRLSSDFKNEQSKNEYYLEKHSTKSKTK